MWPAMEAKLRRRRRKEIPMQPDGACQALPRAGLKAGAPDSPTRLPSRRGGEMGSGVCVHPSLRQLRAHAPLSRTTDGWA